MIVMQYLAMLVLIEPRYVIYEGFVVDFVPQARTSCDWIYLR